MKTLRIFALTMFFSLQIWGTTEAIAQCAMCKQSVESNLEGEGKVVGKGLNNGIMYLMSIPYLVLGGIGYMVYKNWKGGKDN